MKAKTFILVHGAWHGGWVWRRVARELIGRGHNVFAPTLSGCGERAHLLSRETNLELNIRDIEAVIECEELNYVLLCGHSYAGLIIRAVADRMPDRIKRLVFIDAYVPDDGNCLLDLRSEEDNRQLLELTRNHGDGWRMPSRTAEEFRVRDEADRSWINRRLTDTALACFKDRVQLVDPIAPHIDKVYVRAGDFPSALLDDCYRKASESPDWTAHMIDNSGHDIMVDQPSALCTVLDT